MMSREPQSAFSLRYRHIAAVMAVVHFVAVTARADVVWPAVLLTTRMESWWAVVVGLLLEWPVIRLLTGCSWKGSAWITLTMNFTSAIIGAAALPSLGMWWELSIGDWLHQALRKGSFNPVTWTVTIQAAVLINTIIEAIVVRWWFRVDLTWIPLILWIGLVNTASVVLAFASVYVVPVGLHERFLSPFVITVFSFPVVPFLWAAIGLCYGAAKRIRWNWVAILLGVIGTLCGCAGGLIVGVAVILLVSVLEQLLPGTVETTAGFFFGDQFKVRFVVTAVLGVVGFCAVAGLAVGVVSESEKRSVIVGGTRAALFCAVYGIGAALLVHGFTWTLGKMISTINRSLF